MKKFVSTGTILFSMLAIQIAWILGIWITGASGNRQKLIAIGIFSTLSYLLVVFLPKLYSEKIDSFFDYLAYNRRVFLILLAIVLVVGGIFYASQQRIWPFDEERNYQASELIADRGLKEFFNDYALNNYLANRHPPLIPMINGAAMFVFGDNLMTIRMVSLVFGFALLVSSYFLAAALYGKKTGVLTVVFLLTFPLIIRESTAGLLDVQASFFFTIALLLPLKISERPSWALAVGLGLSLGLGFLTKYMVLFILPLLVLLFLFWRNYRTTAPSVFLSLSLAGALFLVWTGFGSQIGVRVPAVAGFSPSDLFAATLKANVRPAPNGAIIEEIALSPGYFLTSAWGRGFLLDSLLTKLPSGLGAFNLPLILLGLTLLIKRRHASDWFLLLWIGVISVLLVLTLPDHRYFMVIFPALAIIIATWIESRPPAAIGKVTFLALLYQLSALFLLIDWNRVNELFMK